VKKILDDFAYGEYDNNDFYKKRYEVVGKIISTAPPFKQEDWEIARNIGERALCPLCGRGSQSQFAHERGFKLPTGLQRHLEGDGGAHRCEVFWEMVWFAKSIREIK